jgi:hypothetical protein
MPFPYVLAKAFKAVRYVCRYGVPANTADKANINKLVSLGLCELVVQIIHLHRNDFDETVFWGCQILAFLAKSPAETKILIDIGANEVLLLLLRSLNRKIRSLMTSNSLRLTNIDMSKDDDVTLLFTRYFLVLQGLLWALGNISFFEVSRQAVQGKNAETYHNLIKETHDVLQV